MAERLILVRHGACENGGAGRLIGVMDVPLTAQGERQAQVLAQRLRVPEGAHVLCSPLRRARQTAAAVMAGQLTGTSADHPAAAAGVAVAAPPPRATRTQTEARRPLSPGAAQALPGVDIDDDLREVDVGIWEGRPVGDLAGEFPREMSRWAAWDQSFVFPGGEELAAFLDRVDRLAGRLLGDPAPAVVCFSHAGVIRSLICRVLRVPTDSYVAFDVRPAGVVVFDVHGDAGVLRSLVNLEDDEWRMWS